MKPESREIENRYEIQFKSTVGTNDWLRFSVEEFDNIELMRNRLHDYKAMYPQFSLRMAEVTVIENITILK